MMTQPWESDTPAAKLCRAADKEGVSIDYAARDTEILFDHGIKPKTMTPQTVAEAKRLDRMWFHSFIERAEKLRYRVVVNGVDWRMSQQKKANAAPKPKREPKPKPEPKPEVPKDTSGSRLTSVSSMINRAMSNTKPQTIQEIADKSGAAYSRVKGHMKWLKERHLAKQVGEDKWVSTIEIVATQHTSNVQQDSATTADNAGNGTVFGYTPYRVARWAGANEFSYGETVLAILSLATKNDYEMTELKEHWKKGVRKGSKLQLTKDEEKQFREEC